MGSHVDVVSAYNKLKIPDNFIPKLKHPLPRSDRFNQFLQDHKNDPNEIRIMPCADIEYYILGNHTCDYCIDRGINIQVVTDH